MKPSYLIVLLLTALITDGWSANTGTVTLTGMVPVACNIIVTPASGAVLNNMTTGATDLLVASVNEACNAPNGYYVDMTANNTGSYTGLFIDSMSHAQQPFTIKYDGSALSASRVTAAASPGNVSKEVRISFTPAGGLVASTGLTYTETLGFTITAR